MKVFHPLGENVAGIYSGMLPQMMNYKGKQQSSFITRMLRDGLSIISKYVIRNISTFRLNHRKCMLKNIMDPWNIHNRTARWKLILWSGTDAVFLTFCFDHCNYIAKDHHYVK